MAVATDREVIYLGRDNKIELILKADDAAQSLSGVTHMELIFSGVTFSSVTAGFFDFSGTTTGHLALTFGQATTLAPGSYNAELIVYDVSNTAGVLWSTIPILVKG